ncbi:uncharacterized protein LOC125779782 [Bactrocera dorsalis]|uniref:Uncharacterized protein LOC125779782 n=1 Tax=Bactrocera dorsalis TaxID=27457 RepID=A0ABM3K696_BACDO|nr:uncharacterized protein LOC125779782 [Bactrocera dorsalis]
MANGDALTVDLITRLIADSNIALREEVEQLRSQITVNTTSATDFLTQTIDDNIACLESLDVVKSVPEFTGRINSYKIRQRNKVGRHTSDSRRMSISRRKQSEEQRAQVNARGRAVYRERRAQIRAEFADNQRPNHRQGRVPLRLRDQMEHVGFLYDPDCDYSLHGAIGAMDIICTHCNAAKFRGETVGMCCSSGKVKLPALEPPPEPLQSLLTGESPTSKHFLQNIQAYNSCFQMTSFGATKIIRDPFMPTFKVFTLHGISSETFDIFILQIQGQIYHRAGSLVPFADADYQFLQIYFIGNETDQTKSTM